MSSKFTREDVTNIIIEWAERKATDKEIEFDKNFSVHTDDRDTVRYRTKELTKRFPDNPKGADSGWSLHRHLEPYPHYFYEIDCTSKGLKLKLAIHENEIIQITSKNKCESIMKNMMCPEQQWEIPRNNVKSMGHKIVYTYYMQIGI